MNLFIEIPYQSHSLSILLLIKSRVIFGFLEIPCQFQGWSRFASIKSKVVFGLHEIPNQSQGLIYVLIISIVILEFCEIAHQSHCSSGKALTILNEILFQFQGLCKLVLINFKVILGLSEMLVQSQGLSELALIISGVI